MVRVAAGKMQCWIVTFLCDNLEILDNKNLEILDNKEESHHKIDVMAFPL